MGWSLRGQPIAIPSASEKTSGDVFSQRRRRFFAPTFFAIAFAGRGGSSPRCRVANRHGQKKIPRFEHDGIEKRESTPGRIRTCNLRFRRPAFYPVELRVRLRAKV